MATATRTGLCAVLVVAAAFSAAQSRLTTSARRAIVPAVSTSFLLEPPAAPETNLPYGGGAALFVGAVGVASRVRRAIRLG